ncbi:leukocyte surface antigen CD53-like isoform X1 [Embiotoca jacksoni]|uniref:leukocyte surface antigen CD53-like isoform X1 n=1 Tax=Embiotoca jacksoni TaxID=100190 RepID=UPI003703A9DE
MNRSHVNCLKSMLVILNCLCWLCGAFVVAFGEFQMMHSKFAPLVTTFWPIYPSNTLVVTGTLVTCVCYLGVLGGMRENRCMLISFFVLLFILMLVELAMACLFLVYSREIDTYFERDMMRSLEIYRQSSPESNQTLKNDFDAVQHLVLRSSRCGGLEGQRTDLLLYDRPLQLCHRAQLGRGLCEQTEGVVRQKLSQHGGGSRHHVYHTVCLSFYHRPALLPLQSSWTGLPLRKKSGR